MDIDQSIEGNATPTSPPKAFYQQKLRDAEKDIEQLKKKVKTLQQTKRRLSKRCDASRELVKELTDRGLLSEKGLEFFEATFSSDFLQLLSRATKKGSVQYPRELRAFALTLHFYSAAAYEYVRAKFNNALPSPRTLREWYKAVNGEPGFTTESFDFLKNVAQSKEEPLVAALIVDDMSIRKHVQLVGNKVVGYVDLGTEISEDSLPKATNACVFMLVALNMSLKVPLGYFLIDSLSGSERANLTKERIAGVTAAGVDVVSLTFDGAASNFTMARCLGADLATGHPISRRVLTDSSKKVSIILDPCHMLKLVRNCLGSVDHLVDDQGSRIKWSYIKELEVMQREEGFVARKVRDSTSCEECAAALQSKELPALTQAKSRGGLVAPSKDVLYICEATEKGLQVLQAQHIDARAMHKRCAPLIMEILTMVLERSWFAELEQHLLDCDPLDNHIYKLSKKIAEYYIKIRIHHITKETNRANCKERVRTLLSRIIIFSNQ
ncbi:hypothetical protein MTO96_015341 [Rhipicephalus appendiculatus]